MIKVNGLNKTYFKGKENELNVIKNTSLELPSTGLISFLGPSGSGKTTLLNTIGGLDKADTGSISYDDLEFSKYKMNKVDEYRSKNIGYVFQNYLLLNHLSVYENLRLALELIGIIDKEECKKRIEYALKAVGLYKYRKKPAGNLSGGQQQRVSIARALIKKTKIIIADEPTGNLDSENTIEVMNILKKLSKDNLVLVVTHNDEIADFYSDRIIRLKDGSIESDVENTSTGTLDSQTDRKIHLLDLNSKELEASNIQLHYYYDDEDKKPEITIVVKNNTIYIDSKERCQLVSGSSVELVKDHYKKLEKSEIEDFSYDTSWFDDTKATKGYKGFFRDLGRAFINHYTDPRRRKIFNSIFILIGIAIAVMVCLQMNYSLVDTTMVDNEENVWLIEQDTSKQSDDDFSSCFNRQILLDAYKEGYIQEFYADTYFYCSIKYKLNSTYSKDIVCNPAFYPQDLIQDKNMVVGKKPSCASEVAIGRELATYILDTLELKHDYSLLLGLSINDTAMIKGVVDTPSYSVYVYNGLCFGYNQTPTITVEHVDYADYTLMDGEVCKANDEIMISDTRAMMNPQELSVGKQIQYGANIYTIVGTFSRKDFLESYDVIVYDKSLVGLQFDAEGMLNFYSKTEEPAMFLPNGLFSYTASQNVELKRGEALVSQYLGYQVGESIEYNGMSLKIVGTFLPDSSSCMAFLDYAGPVNCATKGSVILNNVDIFELNTCNSPTLYRQKVRLTDKEGGAAYLESKGLLCKDLGVTAIEDEIISQQNNKKIYPIIEAVLLAVILVYTYFSERAKMIHEIYDIGVLRSLGANKKKIIIDGLLQNFAKATLTTLLGYILTMIVYSWMAIKLNSLTEKTMLSINIGFMLLGVLVLYSSQLIVGILPKLSLLRKTPSEINSKYDI